MGEPPGYGTIWSYLQPGAHDESLRDAFPRPDESLRDAFLRPDDGRDLRIEVMCHVLCSGPIRADKPEVAVSDAGDRGAGDVDREDGSGNRFHVPGQFCPALRVIDPPPIPPFLLALSLLCEDQQPIVTAPIECRDPVFLAHDALDCAVAGVYPIDAQRGIGFRMG